MADQISIREARRRAAESLTVRTALRTPAEFCAAANALLPPEAAVTEEALLDWLTEAGYLERRLYRKGGVIYHVTTERCRRENLFIIRREAGYRS